MSVKAREKPYDWADDEAALTEPEQGAGEASRRSVTAHNDVGEGVREAKPSKVAPRLPDPSGSVSADPVFDIAVDGARNLWADGLLAATVGMPEPVKEGGE